jgi:S-adenosylmethionine:tRNA ribosyltransferase-isomerase
MHDERYQLPEEAAATINAARRAGGRIVAVGTTAVRTLETCANPDGTVTAASGRTEIFIHPPKRPVATDALLTNFHLPKSTLMMLVSAFVGRERLLAAYELAIRERFRFYSYGDCMFIC